MKNPNAGSRREFLRDISLAAAGIAKILFFLFVAIFLVFLVLGLIAGEALF